MGSALLLLVLAASLSLSAPASAARLDPSFGVNGKVSYAHGGSLDYGAAIDEYAGQPQAMAIDEADRILVGGGSDREFLVLRYLPNGTLDNSFGSGGVVRFRDPRFLVDNPYIPRVKAIVPRPDGQILLVGQVSDFSGPFPDGTPDVLMFLLDESGNRVMDFGSRPGYEVGGFSSSIPRSAVLGADGKILIAGSRISAREPIGYPIQYDAYVMHRNADGTPDTDFGPPYPFGGKYGGTVFFPPRGPATPAAPKYSAITSVRQLPNGKILAAGHDRNRLMVTRLTADGKPDTAFGPNRRNAKTVVSFGGRRCRCVSGGAAAFRPNGRIVQVGFSTHPLKNRFATIVLAQYRKNGRIDRSFGKRGTSYLVLKPWVRSTSIALQRNGKILVAARYGFDSRSKFMLLRFLPDGRPDRTFFGNGRYVRSVGDVSTADTVLIESRGRAVVAGGSAQDGTGHFLIRRFLLGRG